MKYILLTLILILVQCNRNDKEEYVQYLSDSKVDIINYNSLEEAGYLSRDAMEFNKKQLPSSMMMLLRLVFRL